MALLAQQNSTQAGTQSVRCVDGDFLESNIATLFVQCMTGLVIAGFL
ncbi:hypothetical protein O9993_12455 [Vibrio lentus]|nr:hypothetical protein [Vibrio lentus]